MKVFVIDWSDSRREELCRLIESSNHKAIPRKSIFKEDKRWHEVPNTRRQEELQDLLLSDSIILHLSMSQKACKEFICEWLVPNDFAGPVALVSGEPFSLGALPGVSPVQWAPETWNPNATGHPPGCINKRKNYFRFEAALSSTNASSIFQISQFLSACENMRREKGPFSGWVDRDWTEAWNALTGESSPLEAKLALLHNLLVPPKDISAVSKSWNALVDQVRRDAKEKQKVRRYETAWKEFLKGNPSQYNSHPFDNRYIELLSELRDSLDLL